MCYVSCSGRLLPAGGSHHARLEQRTAFRLLLAVDYATGSARSAQANGRAERVAGTIRDRLVTELRLAGGAREPEPASRALAPGPGAELAGGAARGAQAAPGDRQRRGADGAPQGLTAGEGRGELRAGRC